MDHMHVSVSVPIISINRIDLEKPGESNWLRTSWIGCRELIGFWNPINTDGTHTLYVFASKADTLGRLGQDDLQATEEKDTH